MSSSDLREAGLRLLGGGRGFESLKPVPVKGARPGAVSTGRPASARNSAQDLAESDYAQREYWSAVTLTSTDGIFTLQVQPIKKIALEDGAVFTFKQPVDP